jgi:hypothetical protein
MPLPGVLEPQITPSPILPPIVSTTPNSEASSPPRPSEPYYPYYDPCFGYSTAALILGGIITPILSVIHVVLLGLTCSRLWRFATRSMSNNNLLLVEQSSSFAATNTGQKGTILVPMSFDSYVNYQQWQQQNNSTVSKVGKESPPKYE